MPSTKTAAQRPVAPDELFPELVERARRLGTAEALRWVLQQGQPAERCAQRLGALHERLLDELHGTRRRSGAYYTPPLLVQTLLDQALEPVIAAKVSAALGRLVEDAADFDGLSPTERRKSFDAILSTTVLDPACGAGAFLEAAGERLVGWLKKAAPSRSSRDLQREVAGQCLFGVDADEAAALLASFVLGVESDGRIHHGDSLLDPSPWAGRRFDVVVGNPPFANAIEGLVDQTTKRRLGEQFPELGGTADLAFYFLVAAHKRAEPEGAVGLVLPRTVLSAPAARSLRERLLRERPPAFIQAPADPLLFPGANVFITLVVLRRGESCLASVAEGVARSVRVAAENWWRAIHVADSAEADRPTVGDFFEVHASMTAGEAYELLPHLREGDEAAWPRFVTTGLIDPGVCLWGGKTCRYLGQRFQRPTFNRESLPEPLGRRVTRMSRPKVLVAGLSTRVEAFCDEGGDHIGAVSTYSIFHPEDDLAELRGLCDHLNSEAAAASLRHELGATALGGGRITLTKRFLKGLKL